MRELSALAVSSWPRLAMVQWLARTQGVHPRCRTGQRAFVSCGFVLMPGVAKEEAALHYTRKLDPTSSALRTVALAKEEVDLHNTRKLDPASSAPVPQPRGRCRHVW